MSTTENRLEATPWILLAIYIIVTGAAATGDPPLADPLLFLILLPAIVGGYLTIRPFYLKYVESISPSRSILYFNRSCEARC